MSEGIAGAAWAFGWGLAAASGALGGALIGLTTKLPHRAIAALVSFGAGLLLSAASISIRIASEALAAGGVALTAGGIVAGAALFSAANAGLASARDRTRCGECKAQLSEAESHAFEYVLGKRHLGRFRQIFQELKFFAGPKTF